MLNIQPISDAKAHSNWDHPLKRQFPNIPDTVANKLELLESIFYDLRKIDQLQHYYLIDPRSEFYSSQYEKKVISIHAKNIYFLSLSLPEDYIVPMHYFYDLEEHIASVQFYRNMCLGINDYSTPILLRKLITDLERSIIYLEKSISDDEYTILLESENKEEDFPSKKQDFVTRLKETNSYFEYVFNELNS